VTVTKRSPDGAHELVNAEGALAMTEPEQRRGTTLFETLFLAEYGRVVAIANRVLSDRHEAEDVAQEVFIDFHRKHPPDATYAAPWLRAAAAHTALNRIRSRKRREQREVHHATDASNQADGLDPEHVVESQETRRQVREALARLPKKPAAVLALRYSGLSYVEVADALGVGVGQVGTLLRRAEAALRKEVIRGSSF
jgi:RNA polymerase sigma factor (sigma-70 family)